MTGGVLQRVINCIQAVTRYPLQLLTADADLERDLGIDSVKRVEIVLALSDEFDVDLQGEQRDPAIRTIGQVSRWVAARVGDQPGETDDTPSRPVVAPSLAEPQQFAPPPPMPAVEAERSAAAKRPRPASAPPNSDGPMPWAYRDLRPPATEKMPPPHFPMEVEDSPSRDRSLAGQIALVTGSGRGIGRTVARVLAARGAHVIVNSFHSREQGEQTVAEVRARGGSATHIWGSVAKPDHVDNIFDQVEREFGHLDILVCNASDGRIGSFVELTADDWDRAFRTNVSGHHQCAVRAAGLMRSRGGGSIVTMSAVGAHRYINGLGSQGVVKAAVETMTRYLACELGRFGIRVNCVAGGPVYGDLLAKFPSAEATRMHWESMTPSGELCSPLNLAETIAFLVSNQARGINGAVWMVDHGFSANADGHPLHNVARQAPMAPAN